MGNYHKNLDLKEGGFYEKAFKEDGKETFKKNSKKNIKKAFEEIVKEAIQKILDALQQDGA